MITAPPQPRYIEAPPVNYMDEPMQDDMSNHPPMKRGFNDIIREIDALSPEEKEEGLNSFHANQIPTKDFTDV
jgi:hypothetical protein